MKNLWITKTGALILGFSLFQLVVGDVHGQSLTGLKLGSDTREALRGDRPGGDSQGPVESGDLDVLSNDPFPTGDGQPDDPFGDLPSPNDGFDPGSGMDSGGGTDGFDPGGGMDSGDDPFNDGDGLGGGPDGGMDSNDDPFNDGDSLGGGSDGFDPGGGMDSNDDPFSDGDGLGGGPDNFDPSGGMEPDNDPFDPGDSGSTPGDPAGGGSIILYRTATCPYCIKANELLIEEGVNFEEKDVGKDPNASAEMAEKLKKAGINTNGVPVIDFKGTIIVGYNEAQLRELCKGEK